MDEVDKVDEIIDRLRESGLVGDDAENSSVDDEAVPNDTTTGSIETRSDAASKTEEVKTLVGNEFLKILQAFTLSQRQPSIQNIRPIPEKCKLQGQSYE